MNYQWAIDKILKTDNKYSRKEWEDYFEYFKFWSLIEKYLIDNELIGTACYYFTNIIKDLDVLPYNPRNGKYLCISKVVIKDGYEKKNIPTIMLLRFLKEYPWIKKVFWFKQTDNDSLRIFNLREVKYVQQEAFRPQL